MSNQKKLNDLAKKLKKKVAASELDLNYFVEPYKHLVIDNFLPEQLAEKCLKHFPSVSDSCWEYSSDTDIEVKYRSQWKSEFDIPDGIIDVVRILNSSLMLHAISERFGIGKVMPDPYFTGGGLNITTRGGLLDVHVDGNYHDASGLNRRFNALLYLNKNWNSEWGGQFGIYDETGTNCLKKIEPIFNRLFIFNTHDRSFHGLPDPLNCPENVERKSIILYYYTKEPRNENEIVVEKPHSALWKKRNLHDKRGNKTRDFT